MHFIFMMMFSIFVYNSCSHSIPFLIISPLIAQNSFFMQRLTWMPFTHCLSQVEMISIFIAPLMLFLFIVKTHLVKSTKCMPANNSIVFFLL